jgi:hypothetical protein
VAGEPWPSTIHDQAEPIYHLAGGSDGGPGNERKIAEHRRGTPTTAADLVTSPSTAPIPARFRLGSHRRVLQPSSTGVT